MCSQIVITDIGRWEDVGGGNLAALPKYTAQVRGISFPFRPGATFYEEFTGRHAAAVNKPKGFEPCSDHELDVTRSLPSSTYGISKCVGGGDSGNGDFATPGQGGWKGGWGS